MSEPVPSRYVALGIATDLTPDDLAGFESAHAARVGGRFRGGQNAVQNRGQRQRGMVRGGLMRHTREHRHG